MHGNSHETCKKKHIHDNAEKFCEVIAKSQRQLNSNDIVAHFRAAPILIWGVRLVDKL